MPVDPIVAGNGLYQLSRRVDEIHTDVRAIQGTLVQVQTTLVAMQGAAGAVAEREEVAAREREWAHKLSLRAHIFEVLTLLALVAAAVMPSIYR